MNIPRISIRNNFRFLIAAGLICAALGAQAGTFQINGMAGSFTNKSSTADVFNTSAGTVDAQTIKIDEVSYIAAHSSSNTVSKSANSGCGITLTVTVEYLPSGSGDVPGTGSYNVKLHARHQIIAYANISTDTGMLFGDTSSTASARGDYMSCSGTMGGEGKGSGMNYDVSQGYIDPNQAYTDTGYLNAGVIFSLQNGHWLGTATFYELNQAFTQSYNFHARADGDVTCGGEYVEMLRVVQISTQNFSDWTSNP